MSLVYITSPRSVLLRRAARLERQAAREAVRAMACSVSPHLVAARVSHSVRFVELFDTAKAIRREARTHARPARKTAGWFQAEWYGSPLVVTNIDVRHEGGTVKLSLVVYIDCDPADFDTPELSKAMHQLVAAINADPTSADWTHAEDLTLIDFVSSELEDGFCVSVRVSGEEPMASEDIPWDDRSVSESWLVLNYSK